MLAGIASRLEKAETAIHRATVTPLVKTLKDDPARLMTLGGMEPDPWQTTLLRSNAARHLLLCTRQGGKSLVAAALALREALLRPFSLVLLLSPTLRQSSELFGDKVMALYGALDRPVETTLESGLRMELANGSRIVSLPGDEKSVRGYSGVSLLVVDEAARVDDALYYTIRPMLAVSRGKLICLSTPFGKRGFFYDEWTGESDWQRVEITAYDCPRITPEFLAEEERALGPRWFRQEYLCSFEDSSDAVFSHEDIQAALTDDLKPLVV